LNIIGEIVECNFTKLTCEALTQSHIPTPGNFITFNIGDIKVISIVSYYWIGSIEGEGKALALWKSKEELDKLYPQLSSILKGYFECVIVGFIENNNFIHGLPSKSIQLHTLVFPSEDKDILMATQNSLFLYSLMKEKEIDLFEVIPWVFYHAYKVRKNDYKYIVDMGKDLNMYLKYDLNLLTPIVQRIDNIIKSHYAFKELNNNEANR